MEESNEEISLRQILNGTRDMAISVWAAKWWVLGAAILMALYFGYKAVKTPSTYNAKMSFMVNDEEGGSSGCIGAVLGQFGLGGGGGKYNYDKITSIAGSNKILMQVLMDSIAWKGRTDLVGNHLIDLYQLQAEWEEDSSMANFRFSNAEATDRNFRAASKELIALLKGDPKDSKSISIVNIGYSDESTILEIVTKTFNADLSIELAKVWYDKISKFYIKSSIERHEKTFKQLTEKADSVYGLLSGSERSYARNTDKLGLITATDNLPRARSYRNIEMYSSLYAEVLKNKETAEFLLKNETPFFSLIDEPVGPLAPQGPNPLMKLIMGAILGSILAIGVIVVRRIVLNALESE